MLKATNNQIKSHRYLNNYETRSELSWDGWGLLWLVIAISQNGRHNIYQTKLIHSLGV
jgi:hypothetical protein